MVRLFDESAISPVSSVVAYCQAMADLQAAILLAFLPPLRLHYVTRDRSHLRLVWSTPDPPKR